MSQTISGTKTSEVSLASGTTTIAPGATIAVSSGNAVYGSTGTFQVINYGSIFGANSGGTNAGIELKNGGNVTNAVSGVIQASYGIYLNAGAGTVVNYGTVSSSKHAVKLTSGGLINNQAGSLYASGGYAVDLLKAGTIINAAGAVIDSGASHDAVYTGSNATIINAGTIGAGKALSATGIRISNNDVVNNLSSGFISGGASNAVQSFGQYNTLINAGRISSASNAVSFQYLGTVTNSSSGIITGTAGGGSGIYSMKSANVNNAGTISGSKYGIQIQSLATITNASTGIIYGYDDGLKLLGASSSVVNSGTIKLTSPNGTAGILLTNTSGTASVANNAGATIIGGIDTKSTSYAALNVTNAGLITEIAGTQEKGIYSAGGAKIVNSASGQILSGNANGIQINAGPLSLNNMGTIKATGSNKSAVYATDSTTLSSTLVNGSAASNAGYISGNSYGIKFLGSASNIISNYGTVRGYLTIYDKGQTTITNAGSIISTAGTTGTAIKLYSNSDLVQLAPTGVVVGYINNTAGNQMGTGATVELFAGPSQGTLNNLSKQLQGFGRIVLDPIASWKLSGSKIVEAIDGFSQGDTLVLTGFAETSATLSSSGVLTLKQSSTTQTINFDSEIVQGDLSISTDGINTTITTVKQTTIANSQTVTIGSGTTANQILIASGGYETVASGGTITGATIAGGVLELGSGSRDVGDIVFSGSGGTLVIDGSAPSNEIGGFTAGDTIELSGIAYNSAVDFVSVGTAGTVTVTAAGVSYDFNIYGVTVGQSNFVLSSDLALTEAVTCFAAGTKIALAHDDIAVEHVRAGMMVHTQSGLRTVKWTGHRSIDLTRHANPDLVRPVCIRAGAIGEGLPIRDLFVSPDHALYLDKILVPAKAIMNGKTIFQTDLPRVTYYHIELATHGAVFAEGVAAESYLDTGNRDCFDGIGNVTMLHPDFAQRRREDESFAPFAEAGPQVEMIRQALLDRAAIATTHDADLRIISMALGVLVTSRWFVPGELFADPRDKRRLGVKIAAIYVDGVPLELDHPDLQNGWHERETDGRWTNGHALIPKSLLRGGRDVQLVIAQSGTYRNEQGRFDNNRIRLRA